MPNSQAAAGHLEEYHWKISDAGVALSSCKASISGYPTNRITIHWWRKIARHSKPLSSACETIVPERSSSKGEILCETLGKKSFFSQAGFNMKWVSQQVSLTTAGLRSPRGRAWGINFSKFARYRL